MPTHARLHEDNMHEIWSCSENIQLQQQSLCALSEPHFLLFASPLSLNVEFVHFLGMSVQERICPASLINRGTFEQQATALGSLSSVYMLFHIQCSTFGSDMKNKAVPTKWSKHLLTYFPQPSATSELGELTELLWHHNLISDTKFCLSNKVESKPLTVRRSDAFLYFLQTSVWAVRSNAAEVVKTEAEDQWNHGELQNPG